MFLLLSLYILIGQLIIMNSADVALFMNLKKVFDTVNHAILLTKLITITE